ncbi:MAG: hypothetical protein AB1646_12570 [Thermodesulfobacteriota bacterium]
MLFSIRGRLPSLTGACVITMVATGLLWGVATWNAAAEESAAEEKSTCIRYDLPPGVTHKPFKFAGEIIPMHRQDVRSRIERAVNFLLLDARGALTGWFMEKGRYGWIFEEVLAKERVPKDFVLFSAVLSGISKRSSSRLPGEGWWALSSPCDEAEGVKMVSDAWCEDRLDPELATRCFASRLKRLREELGGASWLMAAAAYVSSPKELGRTVQRWTCDQIWDLPLPANADELLTRWIALGIIDSHRKAFGITFKDPPPFTYDQVSGLSLAKDLPVSVMARMTGVSSREILEINPKVKVAKGVFPARINGKSHTHALAAPEGRGQVLVKRLKEEGYLSAKK